MGCLKLTYEREFCLSLAGDHKQTLGRRKKRAGTYKYKFNGKELQDELGLNWYDFGARGYMPDIGRTPVQDPLTEKFYGMSSYSFLNNNPLSFIDPNGMLSQSVIDDLWNKSGSGETKWTNNNNGSFSGSNGATADTGEGESPDNGYDEKGKLINNNGGDKTDYKYNKEGKVISSTSVKSIGAVTSSSPLRGYGFKGFAMASGSANQMDFSSPFFAWGMVIKSALGGLFSGVSADVASNSLYHYTNEAGYNAIMESGELIASQGVKNARYGAGQYLTDIAPGQFTIGQTSRRLFGVPWNGSKLTHFLEINTNSLNVIQNAPFNYVVPATNALPISGRIISSGVATFK
jgi:RHS repeat-associated protein